MYNVQWTGDSPEGREKEEKDCSNNMDQPLSALAKDVTCDARDWREIEAEGELA